MRKTTMKILISMFFILNVYTVIGQDNKTLNDTSFATGITINASTIRQYEDNDCNKETSEIILDKGRVVFICDAIMCESKMSKRQFKEYVISYNNKLYLIATNNVATGESYFNQIQNMTPDIKKQFKVETIKTANEYDNECLKFYARCEIKGLMITKKKLFDESEYTEGTSLNISVYNPTKKTIKYIWLTIAGFNPVGDKYRNNIIKTCVGPIEPKGSASYTFTYAWFTDLVVKCSLLSIKVQYMDGTFKTINKEKEITLPEGYENPSE